VHQGSFYSSLESINWIAGKANTICDKPTESKASKETILKSSRKLLNEMLTPNQQPFIVNLC
jgi:hypothetical protein